MLRVAKNQSNTKIIKKPKPKQEEPQQPIPIKEISQSDKIDEQPIIIEEETKLITKSEPKSEPKPESKLKSENKLPRI
jgi:hypothetical protein